MRFITVLCFLLASIVLPVTSAGRDLTYLEGQEIYRKASEAFETGDFKEAIRGYQSLVDGSLSSPDLYFNLGTAHYRNGSPGHAALWFRRATLANPGMPEVAQNFEFLRRQQGFLEFAESDWERFLLGLHPAQLQWSGWILFWSGLFLLVANFLFRLRPLAPLMIGLGSVAIACSICVFSIGHFRASQVAPDNFATVIVSDTSALVAPAPDSAPVIALPAGSEVRILQNTGPWLYASIPGNLTGWIHHTSVEPNWPIRGKSDQS